VPPPTKLSQLTCSILTKFATKHGHNTPAKFFGAAVRGVQHTKNARPCEDVWKGIQLPHAAAIAISDGMGSQPSAAIGARSAATAALRAARAWATAPSVGPDWICRLIEAQWRFVVAPQEPRMCAATCHLFAAHTSGDLVYVGLGDGMALFQSGDQPVKRLSSRPPSDFVDESLALGVNHRISDWTHARLSLPKSPWIAVLVTDGIADDLRSDKLDTFLKWLREDIGQKAPAARAAALRQALNDWPTPGQIDDKTVAVLLGR
jgi:hypothetical protein